MKIISVLAIICIFIEFWHIIYYTFLYDKYFRHADDVSTWAYSYNKLHKSFIDFADYYVDNEELQEALGSNHFHVVENILNLLNKTGPSSEAKKKIFEICPMKEIILFFIQQAIEVCYWFILLALAIIMPYATGIVLFVVITVLVELQKHFNKNKNTTYMVIDSLFCIILYAITIFVF